MRRLVLVVAGMALASIASVHGSLCAGPEAEAPPARFVERESIVAILTHRGGFAKGLAHDHLIAAPLGAVQLRFREAAPEASSFLLEFPVEELLVDDSELRKRWSPRLVELGLLAEPMDALDEKDRAKIRTAMLDKDQLDASSFPTMRMELDSIRKESTQVGGEPFAYVLSVAFTIHGTTVHRDLAGRMVAESNCPSVEAVGGLTFSALGIHPYSAALGAVRNRDEMDVYLYLTLDC